MLHRKIGRTLALIMLFSLGFVSAAQAEVHPPTLTDGPADTAVYTPKPHPV